MRIGVVVGAAVVLGGCLGGDGPGGGEPDPVGDALSRQLAGQAQVSPLVRTLEHKLKQPVSAVTFLPIDLDSCNVIEERLQQACSAVYETMGTYCTGTSTFFWAHDVPRCGARVELSDGSGEALPTVYAFDLAGQARASGPDTCGDGEVQAAAGETCDDGNRELWDGCDSNCKMEEFTGCETVIENEFAAANLAWVDRAAWDAPRSHLMVNTTASSLRPVVDSSLCAEAATVASGVCERLQADMPFVGWCYAQVEYEPAPAACHVRLNVTFRSLDPSYGVFTTALPGILSFTIR
jgi:cysteine-rich repeat protein